MEIRYVALGGRFVCCRLENIIIVDIKYQREFDEFMLVYERGLDAVVSEFSACIGL
jgi:hypothetical protein